MELMQRNLSLGYAKFSPQLQDQIIFDFDSVKAKQLKMTAHFYKLEELEQIDQETAKLILKNYQKDIKSLFLKYALMSSVSDHRGRDEASSSIMSFTEVIKMLNQKGIGFVNKLVIGDLIASINTSKRKDKNVLYGVEEVDFNEFLIKLTDYIIQT